MERSLKASATSSATRLLSRPGAIMEELSFSVSGIMLLTSLLWKESKVKICPSLILSTDSRLFRLLIWYRNHSFSLLLRRCSSSSRADSRYTLSFDVRYALL